MKRHDLEFVSIARMVLTSAEHFGPAEAVVDLDAGVRWSFADVAERMIESVRAAIAFGVQSGDRVALWAPNGADWIVAALGVLGAGAILVPLNTRFKGREAGYILRKSGSKAVLTVPKLRFPEWEVDWDNAVQAHTSTVRGWERLLVVTGTAH